MRLSGLIAILFGLVLVIPFAAPAQQLQALARLELDGSSVTARQSGDVDIVLKLTQGVPYRVMTLDKPRRLVIDFQEVRFGALKRNALVRTNQIKDIRFGLFRPGWSRLVLEMALPLKVAEVSMQTSASAGSATIRIRLVPQSAVAFTAEIGAQSESAAGDIWALPEPVETSLAKTRPMGERKIVIALDPGHGGIDPGAQYQALVEADLMLNLARELKETLILSGDYEVFLTRDEDVFLSLQGRITRAREGGADIFISLHADALAAGTATGTTIYTLSDVASDAAAAALAASHERSDLLAGVDLAEQDDQIVSVLMDLARIETRPRSEKLAEALVAGIAQSVGKIRSRPRLSAGFSVLKAPDIPSVLVEFGFMSNPLDLSNLSNPAWRKKAISGILAALDKWSLADAAEARLLRQ
ncbi:MAG: N-acetylmuramoyl-L-alanine amidase [Alphaproteobacteria bacterium]|nr:N-acetylmuramoyl-L-alanine amidase [Alphaproteobacteria bacterium]